LSPSARRVAAWAARRGEVLLSAAAALLGLFLFADNASASVFWAAVGFAVMMLGLLNLRGAVLRLRLARDGDGPGVVLIDEGQIAYMGPDAGGIVAIDAIDAIALGTGADGPVLRITRRDGPPIAIPMAAQGADGLIDALAVLPGFDPGALAKASAGRPDAAGIAVWTRRDSLAFLPPE
jgi:hypothetical protein